MKSNAKVIIVCSEASERSVRHELNRLATTEWDESGQVRLLVVQRELMKRGNIVTQRIDNSLSSTGTLVLVPKEIEVATSINSKCFLQRPGSIEVLLREMLPDCLENMQLDWLSQIERKLRGWRDGEVDRGSIEKWLDQFKRLGNNRWIGEELLKRLDFWSDNDVRNALRVDARHLAEFDCICINRNVKAGKSADVISNVVRKQLDAPGLSHLNIPLQDIHEALSSRRFRRILYVEDCLITGNELSRILGGLLGVLASKDAKAAPLSHADMLTSVELVFRFAVVTNYGLNFIEQFLESHNLPNVSIDTRTARVFPVLTPSGVEALKRGAICDEQDCLLNSDLHISPFAFTNWTNEDKRKRTMDFCSEVGYQLYQSYLQSHNKPKSEAWVRQCALGVRQAALTTTFSHSIPKETLPLFWANGTIQWGRKNVLWTPLFQAAE